jgi:hypothetical protein
MVGSIRCVTRVDMCRPAMAELGSMLISTPKALVVATILTMSSVGYAQNPGKVDMEASELSAEVIGAPVSDPYGTRIGEVVDLSFDEEGQPNTLRMKTDAVLGFGERTVEVPKGAFMLLRGAVVIDLPADAVQSLPEIADDEK